MHRQPFAVLNCSRGQGAIEMLVLLSFFLLFSIPLISLLYLNATQGAQDASLLQAKQTAREIAQKAGSAYIQGEGTSERLVVVFPTGLQEIKTSNKELTLVVAASAGQSDVVAMGAAEMRITGAIGTEPGPHGLVIKSKGGYVEISEGFGEGDYSQPQK